MRNDELILRPAEQRLTHLSGSGASPTVRDVVSVVFRRRRAMFLAFCVVALTVLLFLALQPSYRAEMKVLVKQERVDPRISADASGTEIIRNPLTLQEINAEVELLRSRDLLREVVAQADLVGSGWSWRRLFSSPEEVQERRIARAVSSLSNDLDIEPIANSNVILVQYASGDPRLSARVLELLSDLYLEKHLAVRRVPGRYDFFRQRMEEYKAKLQNAEQELKDFGVDQAVSPAIERDNALKALSEARFQLQATQSAIAETRTRLRMLDHEARSRSDRIVTAQHTYQNPELMQDLNSTLLKLELRRTELLTKFTPEYKAVKEVDQQIAQTKRTIAAMQSQPLKDVTTDRDPTYTWIDGEVAKNNAELRSLASRHAALNRTIAALQEQVRALDGQAIAAAALSREATAQQENYLLYIRKAEEARISDQMDHQRMLNVAIAEPPQVPALPARSLLTMLLFAIGAGVIAALIVMFILEVFDRSFRTPEEVERFLDLPVLAAVPASSGHKQLPGSGFLVR